MDGIALITLKLITMAVLATGLVAILFLPGLWIMWFGALVYGLLTGFSLTSGFLFGVITLLALAGSLLDNFFIGLSIHRQGASWLSFIPVLLVVLGVSLFLTPIGGFAAGLLTFLGIEWYRQGSFVKAIRSLKAWMVGYGWSVVFAICAGLMIFIVWGIWILVV